MRRTAALILGLVLANSPALAGDSTAEAVIGGAIGGAAGAAIGSEMGGREGAILGGALGAALGTAVTTDDDRHHRSRDRVIVRERVVHDHEPHRGGHFCPPGQAKKGRC